MSSADSSASNVNEAALETGGPPAKVFELHGVKLEIPSNLLTPRIQEAITSGKYEHLEARQLPRFLRAGDRLLEFGAGLGFISALCSKTVELDSCAVVEANPDLIPVIRRNHLLNGVTSDILNMVSLSPQSPMRTKVGNDNKIPFYIYDNFWGSSLSFSSSANRIVNVETANTQDIIDRFSPTVIICDIEGGELDIFDRCDLSGVNNVFFEVHKSIIGLSGINHVINTLSEQNLYYNPDFSVGATMMFSRV